MPWAKTDAGRLEIQSRSLVNHRPQRNLLLLVDGKKTEQQLLASVTGVAAADLLALRDLGLIASPDHPVLPPPPPPPPLYVVPPADPLLDAEPAIGDEDGVHIDIPVAVPPPSDLPSFAHVSKTLTSLIASELGLRGFTLTLAVERASGIEALLEVADRVLTTIETRKGPIAAAKGRRAIFGG